MSFACRLWLGFSLVMVVLLTAMGWMTLTAMRLDRAEAAARHQAVIDENIRLALWRMDSALAPLLAQEGVHPYYRDGGLSLSIASERLASNGTANFPTPLNASDKSYALLRFQHPVGGSDVPQPEALQLNVAGSAENSLSKVGRRISLEHLLAKLPASDGDPFGLQQFPTLALTPSGGSIGDDEMATSRAVTEFQQRSQSLITNSIIVQQIQTQQQPSSQPSAREFPAVMMTPVWTSDEMVLARRVSRAGTEYVEGCLLDWPAMERWLLELVHDLLPRARLQPLEDFDPAGEIGLLAALPVRLQPGSTVSELQEPGSAVPQMLALAWCAVLLAAIAGAVLVAGVVRLSQRRAAFVSAVTHELRTPLTTFRMYTEMLVQGMVRDPEAQRSYLQTLRDESLRLSHLVENVLAYARLERGRGLAPPEEILLTDLLAPMLPRLEQQASEGRMKLVVGASAAALTSVRANPSAVEQILMNLVDNACKYAGTASDRRIQLSARREGCYLAIQLRDYGPGMPAKRKWFQPFGKTAQEAAHTAPGIGLGLGLSRQLAEQMGGRLDVAPEVTDGAALVLRLRLVNRSNQM